MIRQCGILAIFLPVFAGWVVWACHRLQQPDSASLLNTSHLDYLYQPVEINDKTMGAIWIYCEAPNYRYVDDDDEGFTCVDDVARALVFYCRQYRAQPDTAILRKVRALTEFILYMQADNGYFYNFLWPSGQINTTHLNSQPVPAFWAWRAFWALSELAQIHNPALADLQRRSEAAMARLLSNIEGLCTDSTQYCQYNGIRVPACLAELGGDQAGLILLVLGNRYQSHPSNALKNLMLHFGQLLLHSQLGDANTSPYGAFLSWKNHWHAWGNIQSYALLRAGRLLGHTPFIQAALQEVEYFYPYCLAQGMMCEWQAFKEAGDSIRLDIQRFPQIAYGVRPMVFAALEAFETTGKARHLHTAVQLAAWLLGANPTGTALYNPATGRTFDGIVSATDINRNAGAESTIESLLTLQAVEAVPQARQQLLAYFKHSLTKR